MRGRDSISRARRLFAALALGAILAASGIAFAGAHDHEASRPSTGCGACVLLHHSPGAVAAPLHVVPTAGSTRELARHVPLAPPHVAAAPPASRGPPAIPLQTAFAV